MSFVMYGKGVIMNICRDGLEGGHKSFNPDMVPCEYDMLQKTYFKLFWEYH